MRHYLYKTSFSQGSYEVLDIPNAEFVHAGMQEVADNFVNLFDSQNDGRSVAMNASSVDDILFSRGDCLAEKFEDIDPHKFLSPIVYEAAKLIAPLTPDYAGIELSVSNSLVGSRLNYSAHIDDLPGVDEKAFRSEKPRLFGKELTASLAFQRIKGVYGLGVGSRVSFSDSSNGAIVGSANGCSRYDEPTDAQVFKGIRLFPVGGVNSGGFSSPVGSLLMFDQVQDLIHCSNPERLILVTVSCSVDRQLCDVKDSPNLVVQSPRYFWQGYKPGVSRVVSQGDVVNKLGNPISNF